MRIFHEILLFIYNNNKLILCYAFLTDLTLKKNRISLSYYIAKEHIN